MAKGPERLTAEGAWQEAAGTGVVPYGATIGFVCPYPDCAVFSRHYWGGAQSLTVPHTPTISSSRAMAETPSIWFAACEACERETVFIDGRLVWPEASQAPAPNVDMPDAIRADFEEARQIYSKSPRGAAALLRLAIQKLCGELGANPKDINQAIGELVREQKISGAIQQALDAVRVIGNEAVHPGVMDLKDDQQTAVALFGLVNFIVEKAISEPKHVAAIYGSLPPGKLAGIAQRDS